jgi:restriction system protein
MRMNQNSGQIFRFLNNIKIGDIVITPYADNQLLIGKVLSDYYFEIDDQCKFAYRKKVKWYPNTIDRQQFSIPLQNSLRSSLTCFSISQHNEILHAIGESPEINTLTPIFDEHSLYNKIKEKLLELGSDEFEELVNYTLISLGFEAKQSTGKVGDGGIDFEGKLNVMGVASINLQVQVKRYDKSIIGEGDIRNFRGALKKDYQGCFITLSSFNKKAIESANDQNKVQIYLIDGNKFIDIFIEQYEKITDALYEADNDELV